MVSLGTKTSTDAPFSLLDNLLAQFLVRHNELTKDAEMISNNSWNGILLMDVLKKNNDSVYFF